jgi:hypothetical protein
MILEYSGILLRDLNHLPDSYSIIMEGESTQSSRINALKI